MTRFRVGDKVTVRPPYPSPHLECTPHVNVAEAITDPDGMRYIVTSPTMVRTNAQGGPIVENGRTALMRFGPIREDDLVAGRDNRVARL